MALNTPKQYNVSAAVGGTLIGKLSTANGGDFDVAYTSATTMTFSNYPDGVAALYADDIELVRQIDTDGEVIAVYSRDDNALSISGDVLTVSGAGFNSTDSFVVLTNIPRASTVTASNPEYEHYTSVEILINEADLGITDTATGTDANTLADTNHTLATIDFDAEQVAVGYEGYSEAEDVAATVLSITDGDNIETDSITDWTGDVYWLPECKRFVTPAEGYNHFTIHTRLSTDVAGNSAYIKIYGTLDANADDTDDTYWVDLSTDIFDAAQLTCTGATGTQEGIYFVDEPTAILKYMIKIVGEVTDGGAAAAAGNNFDVYIKKSS